MVNLDDLVDAADVAEIIGVKHATSVTLYRRRYDDFPEPVWASRGGRCQVWLRSDVERWCRSTGRLQG